jgi:hypothetical protein
MLSGAGFLFYLDIGIEAPFNQSGFNRDAFAEPVSNTIKY